MAEFEMITIVIPLMNEEKNVSLLVERINLILKDKYQYEIIFIDDGSTDKTLEEIKNIQKFNTSIKFISFSRNFGHQNALRAGLNYAKGDIIISMDGDLQHPPELIPEMIKKWREGFDIVYTIRENTNDISFFKRKTSGWFYKVLNGLSDVEIEEGSADFRLIDRKVVDAISSFKENPIFYRGIFKWLGFRQTSIPYKPEARVWGETKYSISKMFNFANTGITSFSVRPLRFSTILGIIIAVVAFIYGIYAIFLKILTDQTVPGWTSMLIVVSFIGGIQLLMIGILGEYLGKLFMESKRRPPYIIKEKGL